MSKTEKKLPSSDLEVELVITKRGVQVTAKGTIAQLAKQAKQIQKLVNLIGGESAYFETEIIRSNVEELGAQEESPVIKVAKSTIDNIQSLFLTSWGKNPRNIDEVSSALSANGVPDSDPQVGTALLRLVRGGDLRRIKRSNKWHYFRIPH